MNNEKEKIVPQLRFPEFEKDENWSTKPLKKVFSIFQGYSFSSKDSVAKGTRWVKIADVGIQNMKHSNPSFLPDDYTNIYEKFLLKKGDYVLALTRPILNGKLKISAVDDLLHNSLLNQRVGKLISGSNLTLVYYLLQTNYLIKEIEKSIAGSEPPNLSMKQIENIKISLPSNPKEQQKIANCLSSLDKLITAETEKLDHLKDHKKGLLQQLFPAIGETKPQFRFQEFKNDGDWVETILDNLGEIVTGKTPSTKNEALWNGEVLFITPTDISDKKYQTSTNRTVKNTDKLKILPQGSIVYTCIASIGKMAMTTMDSITNQQINSIVPFENYKNEFIYYLLISLTPYIKSIPATSTLPIINKTQFSEIECEIPSNPKEQQKIASCLSSADDLIEAQTIKIEALKKHKKGLMQQLFPTIK
ncbi:restriction endonuclease subunit S [Polaribacter sp. R77954]|uniref:restriction endonuclease subunit S n=1 Tax=Polaribacter sp. R77954 TaxID=3093870 RepID=UPI0037C89114